MTECFWCDGTGEYKQPNSVTEFEELFDKYDGPGTLSMGECREKALKKVGYKLIKCQYCNGTGVKE